MVWSCLAGSGEREGGRARKGKDRQSTGENTIVGANRLAIAAILVIEHPQVAVNMPNVGRGRVVSQLNRIGGAS